MKETIDSVLKQDIPFWEHIIVDDCSTDKTWETLNFYKNQDSRIKIYMRDKEPKGAQTCRNIGAINAQGQYLVFLDSDDLLKPYCIKNRIEFIENHAPFDLAVFPKKKIKAVNRTELLSLFLNYKLPLQTTDSLWFKEYFNKIGLFNEQLVRFQDVELSIRALLDKKINLKFCKNCHPDSIYTYQESLSEGNNSKIIYHGLKLFVSEVIQLLREHGNNELIPLLRSYLRSWLIHEHVKGLNYETKKLLICFKSWNVINAYIYYLSLVFAKVTSFRKKGRIRKLFYYLVY
ncbi:MAG: glycosyltransferase [Chloroflexia bacterium]|nr:glycosyltransferase [Chloroflexia bacterium]